MQKKNLKNAVSKNLESFGKDKDHNVLYVVGLAGGGKSTTALGVRRNGDVTIHLDGYTEGANESVQDKRFNDWIDRKYPGLRKDVRYDKNKGQSTEYFQKVEKFADAIENYSEELYKTNNRVIVEGVQIYTNWLRDDRSFYNDKPLVVIKTDKEKALKRLLERDNVSKAEQKQRAEMIADLSDMLTNFEKSVIGERGKRQVWKSLGMR